MKNKPLLTIGIPNYNGGKDGYLEMTIKSCKNLDLNENELEILVVDNCSTDNSVEVIKELQKTIKNLKLVENETNVGRVGNRNRCLELANSEFLLIESIGDTINKVDIRNNLFEMKEKKIHIGYGDKEELNIKEINLFFAFPNNLCEDYKFHFYLGGFIFNLDIIKNNNLTFDKNLNYFSDIKFEYDYLKILKYGKRRKLTLFSFNNNKIRFDNTGFITMFYDIVYLFDYESKKYKLKYNKTKLLCCLTSWFIMLYFKKKFSNTKVYFKDIIEFLHYYNIYNIYIYIYI